MKRKLLDYLTLFTTTGTILCCALPAFLVAIGAGSVFAALVGSVPGLVWLSVYKDYLFAIAGILLLVSGWFRYKNRNAACPADKDLAVACKNSRKFSDYIYYISITLFLIGGFFAYVAQYIWN